MCYATQCPDCGEFIGCTEDKHKHVCKTNKYVCICIPEVERGKLNRVG